MSKSLGDDLEKLLNALARMFAEEGKAPEVALLAHSRVRIQEKLNQPEDPGDYDEWTVVTRGYTVYLESPFHLYVQVAGDREKLEQTLRERATGLIRVYDNEYIEAFIIVPELPDDDRWREKAKSWVDGKGVTNQGRARSDNVAPLMCDGLLFRSPHEINLYRALRSKGVSFAPLPVFVRGGQTYRRIEPDFVLLKDGIVMIVEVDGDTVHRESPQEAHDRVTMLLHEGANVERVNATECATAEKAQACAVKILSIIEKLKTNRG